VYLLPILSRRDKSIAAVKSSVVVPFARAFEVAERNRQRRKYSADLAMFVNPRHLRGTAQTQ
jgi:hypothetical protein